MLSSIFSGIGIGWTLEAMSNRECKCVLQYKNILIGQKAQLPVTTMLDSTDTLVTQKERRRNRHADR